MGFGFGGFGNIAGSLLGGGGSGGGTMASIRQKILAAQQAQQAAGQPASQPAPFDPSATQTISGNMGAASTTTSHGMMSPTGQPMIPPGPNQTPFPSQGPLANYTGGGINVDPASVGTTPQNIMDSPAYQFRLNQGNQAVQQSAAAKGSLLTGGTLKDMQDYAQGLASTEFGNQWDRDYRLSALNSGISEGNAGRTLSGLSSLMGQGYGAAGQMGGYEDQSGNYAAGGTVGGQSALNQGIGGAVNTIGGYLAQRRLRQQQGGQPAPVMWGGPTDVTATA